MNWDAFFTLHKDLPREGPGCPEDVTWACEVAQVPKNARILDAGCGPGADIADLLSHAPMGHVLAVDMHEPFAVQALAKHSGNPRVRVKVMDMAKTDGPFDFIWSAGALYFLGIENGLKTMSSKLAPNGTIAFSHLCYLAEVPHPNVSAVFDNEPDVMGQNKLQERINGLGFEILGQRVLPDAAWAAYNDPIRARIADLRPLDDPKLDEVLREAEAEIDLRDNHADQYGYVLSVVRPE